ncbi:hypothetical protein GRI00_02485 [Pediococcus pentosaceus]|nr:hypothetical protein GRI00_02485 [Pediococcus pentosaceus]
MTVLVRLLTCKNHKLITVRVIATRNSPIRYLILIKI